MGRSLVIEVQDDEANNDDQPDQSKLHAQRGTKNAVVLMPAVGALSCFAGVFQKTSPAACSTHRGMPLVRWAGISSGEMCFQPPQKGQLLGLLRKEVR